MAATAIAECSVSTRTSAITAIIDICLKVYTGPPADVQSGRAGIGTSIGTQTADTIHSCRAGKITLITMSRIRVKVYTDPPAIMIRRIITTALPAVPNPVAGRSRNTDLPATAAITGVHVKVNTGPSAACHTISTGSPGAGCRCDHHS